MNTKQWNNEGSKNSARQFFLKKTHATIWIQQMMMKTKIDT